jgi:hypothetical protein
MRHWSQNFQRAGNVEDAPRSGRPSRVTPELLNQACDIFRRGWKRPVFDNKGVRQEEEQQMFFTSINDALARSPALGSLLGEMRIKPPTLLQRMMKHDPTLQCRSTDYRMMLTQQQKEQRRKGAGVLYQLWQGDPAIFMNTVSIDCASITFQGGSVPRAHYYCDESEPHYHYVVPFNAWPSTKRYTFKFIVAVNPRLGGVKLAFTTGTTALSRDSDYQQYIGRTNPYMVSHVLLWMPCQVVAPIATHLSTSCCA